MKLLEDMLGSIEGDAPVRDLRVCLRATAVWSRRLGLAYTFPRAHLGHIDHGQRRPLPVREGSARQLADLSLSEDLVDASIGVAALNSLLDPPEERLRAGNAYELILARGGGKDVTVVGHFPFVTRLREQVRRLWVLELRPEGEDLPASEAARVIPRSDVVAITGTTLINHTLPGLLDLARSRYTILLGPSTPLSPVFLDHGVDAVCGSVVSDPEAALECVSQGVSFRHTAGLRPVLLEGAASR